MTGIDTFTYTPEKILSLVIKDWHTNHDSTHMNFEVYTEKENGGRVPRWMFKDSIVITAAKR